MPDYTVTVPAEAYTSLVRKAIAFDMVCKVVKSFKSFQWDAILEPLCFSIAQEESGADEKSLNEKPTTKTE